MGGVGVDLMLPYRHLMRNCITIRCQWMYPPAEPTEAESLYLRKLLDAYGDRLRKPITVREELMPYPELEVHYNRQRVLFYSAESLRNFARDRTPPRTFDSLQDDVYIASDGSDATEVEAQRRPSGYAFIRPARTHGPHRQSATQERRRQATVFEFPRYGALVRCYRGGNSGARVSALVGPLHDGNRGVRCLQTTPDRH